MFIVSPVVWLKLTWNIVSNLMTFFDYNYDLFLFYLDKIKIKNSKSSQILMKDLI